MDMRDIKEFFKDFFIYIIIGVLIFFTVVYVVSLQQVRGPSMEPNYNTQDVLLLNKLHYHIFKPKRFDVVAVLDHNDGPVIKRIIGLPGEKIEYKDNNLYINDQLVEELFKKSNTEDFVLDHEIGKGQYFIVGDNREKSDDSRTKGLITQDNLIGKVMFRIWKGWNNGIY